MVTFTADTNGGVLYLDGVANTNRVWRGNPLTATGIDPLVFGKYQYYPDSQSKFFKGSVSDVVIYNRALSSNEVASLYKMDLPRDIASIHASANPAPTPIADRSAPTLTLVAPSAPSVSTRAQRFTLRGNASDNVAPTAVQFRIRQPGRRIYGAWAVAGLAPGSDASKAWTLPVALSRRGSWVVQVRALDASGNSSATRTVTITRR
jgi:hypothetical protein